MWIKDAPVYGQSDISEVISFIDRYVTWKKDPTMPNLVNYQTHRHARTCRKKRENNLQVQFPYSAHTIHCYAILQPLNDDDDDNDESKGVAEKKKIFEDNNSYE